MLVARSNRAGVARRPLRAGPFSMRSESVSNIYSITKRPRVSAPQNARVRTIIVTFVVTRLVLAAAVLLAIASVPPQPCPTCADASTIPLLAGLARWDGAAYLQIARDGYAGPGAEGVRAYFPLYPALMRVLGTVLGGTDDALLIAGIVISNAATLVAAAAIARSAAARVGAAAGTLAATYLLVFPTTIFLSAAYPDALFIALAILTAADAAHGRLWRASALATAAALTRPFGAIALIPLVAALWRARLRPARDLLALLPPPAAFVLWNAYLYSLTGDPLASLHSYSSGFTPRSPVQAITDLFDPSVYGFPWFVAASFALFVVLVVLSLRVMPPPDAAFATAMFVVIVGAGSLASSMRYELSIYPAFVTLAWLLRGHVARVTWLAASAAIAVTFAAMFAVGFWVA